MNADVYEWRGRRLETLGGGGPGGTETERRIRGLEQRVERIESKVDRIEHKLERHDEALRRIEEALKSLADDNKAIAKSVVDLCEKVAHIDGWLANIPPFWQTITLMATLLLGIAGLIFAASRFLHP